MLTRLAGVKFNNDPEDGGRSRQDILREMVETNRSIFTADLVYTRRKEQFVIKVRDHATKQIIGWIPKEDLVKFKDKKIKQLTGFIKWYGLYCVSFEEQQAPTHKQYAYMKHLCEMNEWKMPAYDQRAYKPIFDAVAKTKAQVQPLMLLVEEK